MPALSLPSSILDLFFNLLDHWAPKYKLSKRSTEWPTDAWADDVDPKAVARAGDRNAPPARHGSDDARAKVTRRIPAGLRDRRVKGQQHRDGRSNHERNTGATAASFQDRVAAVGNAEDHEGKDEGAPGLHCASVQWRYVVLRVRAVAPLDGEAWVWEVLAERERTLDRAGVTAHALDLPLERRDGAAEDTKIDRGAENSTSKLRRYIEECLNHGHAVRLRSHKGKRKSNGRVQVSTTCFSGRVDCKGHTKSPDDCNLPDTTVGSRQGGAHGATSEKHNHPRADRLRQERLHELDVLCL
mmetsp:Transcript_82581/g.230268  ORF Transcript_82581/g.230268 Transcript_82581/m.230268 type:complete len:299 (-) Transcript_82581:352-1248(-)